MLAHLLQVRVLPIRLSLLLGWVRPIGAFVEEVVLEGLVDDSVFGLSDLAFLGGVFELCVLVFLLGGRAELAEEEGEEEEGEGGD